MRHEMKLPAGGNGIETIFESANLIFRNAGLGFSFVQDSRDYAPL